MCRICLHVCVCAGIHTVTVHDTHVYVYVCEKLEFAHVPHTGTFL